MHLFLAGLLDPLVARVERALALCFRGEFVAGFLVCRGCVSRSDFVPQKEGEGRSEGAREGGFAQT